MRTTRCRPRVSQPTLFHPPPLRLSFRRLPSDIQEKTIRVLARLLRLHADQARPVEAREARHE